MTIPFQFIGEEETATLLSMREAVDVCEAVLREQGMGRAMLSKPSAIFLDADPAAPVKFKVKGGSLLGLDVSGFRVVGDIGKDGCIGEHHYCLLLDPVSAQPRALVAQTELHRIRTAACGLTALRKLVSARTQTFALIGAGKIGAWFAKGFADVFPGKELLVASRRLESARALASEVDDAHVRAATIDEAMAAADGVVALTTAEEPVFDAQALRTGATLIGMGEYHELSAALLDRADLFIVDDFDFASQLGSLSYWLSRGDVTREAAQARVSGTLSDIVAGRSPGRADDDQTIVAIVQGLAIADLALADLCRRRKSGAA